jgi:methylated-DNA-[protein]-cysteine S-methyltransferase
MDSVLLKLVLFDTCRGWMGAVSSLKGLKQIILPQKSREEVLSTLKGDYSLVDDADALFNDLPQRLQCYLSGEPVDFPDRLDFEGTTVFRQKVWIAAQAIPYGETRSYAWISGKLGYDSRASRAAGQALGKNPLPIIIPCHRVLNAGGGLGGFSAGLELKRYLLRLESGK